MKLCVIYSHYYVDEVVKYRFDNLRSLNPDAQIVPVGLSGYTLLPNSLFVDRNIWPNNNNLNCNISNKIDWTLGDLCVYQTFLNHNNFDYYFLIEYDTAFNTSILDFFDIESKQYAGNVPDCNLSKWCWFKRYKFSRSKIKKIPDNELASTGPTTCLWWSHNILQKVVTECFLNKNIYCNMFSELRLGTLTKKFTKISKNLPNNSDFISWDHENIKENHSKFFYHPRKQIIKNE